MKHIQLKTHLKTITDAVNNTHKREEVTVDLGQFWEELLHSLSYLKHNKASCQHYI